MTVLPLFPLHSVLFPGTTMALHVFEARYRELLRRCRESGEGFGVALIRTGREVGGPAVPFEVGTEATIVAVEELPGGEANVLVEGQRRFTIRRLLPGRPYPEGEVEWLLEEAGDAESWRRTVLDLLAATGPVELGPAARDPVDLSYRLADLLAADPGEKQALLEAPSAAERLQREALLLLRTQRPQLGAG